MAKPPPSPLDKKVLARRQKDLEGFIDQHTQMLEQRKIKYAAELEPLWKRILTNISHEIEAIFNLVQDANGVPIVKQPIKQEKMRNMRRQVARLGRLREQLIEMMEIKKQTQKMSTNLAFSYAESYYFHLFGMEQASRVMVAAPLLTLAHVVGAIINLGLPDGKTYSDRIRANTEYLANKMVKTVEQALGSGWSINRTAREIQKRAREGYYNSVRLARTEMTRAAAQGANHSYMQNADIMDGKRWNAIVDLVTAEKDAQNDGEIFALSYDTPENPGQPGKRIPNHPNCRCKWSPVLSAPDNNSVVVKYRVNGGAAIQIYDGPPGAWSFDLPLASLQEGSNEIAVEAIDSYASKSSKKITMVKTYEETPLAETVQRMKILSSTGLAEGALLWVQRDQNTIVSARISMTNGTRSCQ